MAYFLANNAQQLTQLTPWAQFGLAGTVIGALFGTILFFIRQHYLERKEWREDFKQVAGRHDDTVKETRDMFANLHEKTLDAVRSRNA